MTEEDESVENRLDTIEGQLDDLDIGNVERRIESIEDEQEELRDDLGVLVESLREKDKKTPHIESVKALYTRLGTLEQNISELRALLADVIDERSAGEKE